MQKQMNNNTMKVYPISDADLSNMQKSFPELYRDMVDKYGEYAVKNNFLVKFQILTEGAEFKSVDQDDKVIKKIADKKTLELIIKASKIKWYHYFTNFMKGDGNLKSKYNRYPKDAIGYIPIIGNHEDKARVEDKYGWVVSNSLELEQINGKWAITGNGVLINPIAKFNHINDNWFEVSPTIRFGVLDELSYVLHPHQYSNTSFSRQDNGVFNLENPNLDNTKLNNSDIIDLENLAMITNRYFMQKEEYEKTLENHKQQQTIENLKSKGLVSDGQADKLMGVFSFSRDISPHEIMDKVAKIMGDGTNPYANRPRQLIIEGNKMPKTYNEMFEEIAKANPHIQDPAEIRKMVEAEQANQFSGSFNRGELTAADLEQQLRETLDKAKTAGIDISTIIASFSDRTTEDKPADNLPPPPPPADDVILAHKVALKNLSGENEQLKAELAKYEKLQQQVNEITGAK